jgi:Uma2 family endonuclease
MSAQPLPDWFYPPADGWKAEDLDHLPPEAPRRLELIDGALIVMSPQTRFHMEVIYHLTHVLRSIAPKDVSVVSEMTVTLGDRTRPEPDIMVLREEASDDLSRTAYKPDEVAIAIEVVSPDSEERDRRTKPERYAEAGIPHFWRIENEKNEPVVHVYERDETTSSYVPTAIARGELSLSVPFPIKVELRTLLG